jgi:hypothetical protein
MAWAGDNYGKRRVKERYDETVSEV